LTGEGLSFDWAESGGPPAETPKRKGFGTELIDRQLKDALGAKAEFAYGVSGLHAHIVIPKEKIGVGLAGEWGGDGRVQGLPDSRGRG
jgi:two-component sensor histidine kinase